MALHTPNGDGYRVGAIDQKMYLAHRVIWKMVHGTEPDEIDHINHDRSDNRIANLRAATAQINRKNTSRRRDNKSGVTGIYRHSQNGNWVAQISINGKRIHLGSFDSVEAARVARIKAASALDYHANHGKPLT